MCSLIANMSPCVPRAPVSEPLEQAIARAGLVIGLRIAAERERRRWALRELARRAKVSLGVVHGVEAGRIASLPTYVRLARALGMELEVLLNDPRKFARKSDFVHGEMGELEAARLGGHGFAVGVDEPYQHFQFAGRVDISAWDVTRRALLVTENRTRFPDFQDLAGAWNAKRQYFPAELAKRLGLKYGWRSVTHAMVIAWTSEALDDLRARRASIRSLCPDPPDAFAAWWAGNPPVAGVFATAVCSTRRLVADSSCFSLSKKASRPSRGTRDMHSWPLGCALDTGRRQAGAIEPAAIACGHEPGRRRPGRRRPRGTFAITEHDLESGGVGGRLSLNRRHTRACQPAGWRRGEAGDIHGTLRSGPRTANPAIHVR